MKKKAFLIFAIISLWIPSVYSDDIQKGLTYSLDDFSGGLSTKLSEYGLPSKYATIANNIRINSKYKSISRRTNLNTYGSADATEPITGIFRHYMKSGDKVLVVSHGDEIEKGADATGLFTQILSLSTGNRRWQFATWHDILIGTDGYNHPIKYDGTSASATYLGSALATLHGSGSGPAAGAYTYKVSCYSATKEVLLNTASNTITANGNDVDLSMIPICPDTILSTTTTGRKIYRTESGGSTYKLLSNGTIANNTAVTLTDSDVDGALGAAYPAGDATYAPPLGRFLIVQNNRLFLANDPSNYPSRVYYSDDGSHDIFADDSYMDIRQNDGDTITFLKGVLGILTVGKNNTIQKIYIDGTDPVTDWAISDPFSYIGCQAPYSVTNSPLGLIYLARDGLYIFNGQYSVLLSEPVAPVIKDISPTDLETTWGIFHDNIYYLAYNSKESGEPSNNRVLVFDILGKAYSIDLLKINAFTAFNSGNDWGILYGGASDSGNVYAYSNEINEVLHKRFLDFTGLWDDMRYIPEDVGGNADSPILEIARTETIDELSGIINNLVGDINRQDTEGHYVSQPIRVGASALDKVYWNESMPASGGSITFQFRSSSSGERNLILNDDFEFWDNWVTGTPTVEQPNDWTFTQDGAGGSADQSTTEVKRGTYSCKITKSDAGQSYVSTTVPDATNYQSKTLAFSVWVKSANSVGSKVRIQITDGTSTTTTNYANGGAWEELEGTIAVNAAATVITLKCVVETGADAVAYFDRVMVGEASSVANDWSAWSTAVTDSSGSDISSVTANTYVQYLINMSTNDIDYTPNIIKSGQYAIKFNYTKEGTSQTDNIPLRYETGYLDLGDPSRLKIIRSIEAYHSGTTDNYTITMTNFEGDEESWTIDLGTYPSYYKEYTTNGAFPGKLFKVKIAKDKGTEPFEFDKLVIHYDVEEYN